MNICAHREADSKDNCSSRIFNKKILLKCLKDYTVDKENIEFFIVHIRHVMKMQVCRMCSEF